MQDQEPDSPEVSTPDSPYPPPSLDTEESTATPKLLVEWRKKPFEVVITQYVDNGNTCICLLNPDTGGVEAKATANLHRLPPHRVHIKDYSENRGIAEVLVGARLIERAGGSIRSGSEEFEEYQILPRLARPFSIDLPDREAPKELDPTLTQAIAGEKPSAGPQVEEPDSPSTMPEFAAQQNAALVQKAQEDKAREEQLEEDSKIDPA